MQGCMHVEGFGSATTSRGRVSEFVIWREVMADDIRNVFISHIHEDDAGLGKVKSLLDSKGVKIRDYSINRDNPNNAHSEEYIKNQILAPRIQKSGALAVYITSDTKESKYVDWEIQYAAKLGKRVIGIWAQGENGCEIPEALEKYADAVVGWNGGRVIDALNGTVQGWYNPDGSPCNERDIKRYSCG